MEEQLKCKRCGCTEYYVIDVGVHKKAMCVNCKSYIKFVPQGKPAIFYFGKYKGREISSMVSQEERQYLKWYLDTGSAKPTLRKAIEAQLKTPL